MTSCFWCKSDKHNGISYKKRPKSIMEAFERGKQAGREELEREYEDAVINPRIKELGKQVAELKEVATNSYNKGYSDAIAHSSFKHTEKDKQINKLRQALEKIAKEGRLMMREGGARRIAKKALEAKP